MRLIVLNSNAQLGEKVNVLETLTQISECRSVYRSVYRSVKTMRVNGAKEKNCFVSSYPIFGFRLVCRLVGSLVFRFSVDGSNSVTERLFFRSSKRITKQALRFCRHSGTIGVLALVYS